eukprot:CAMPEP_0172637676 /NCGR_PEP_ID=MMETSP1068-20121228/210083_1 /TAXON_ID=35684 /ORGANISM="Pseudopedinella elastica, Strain CCMP716" /LENGTH=45 /DNA_ID= /DNA_START= /DNA_END= /DNA_ORIENTATION=
MDVVGAGVIVGATVPTVKLPEVPTHKSSAPPLIPAAGMLQYTSPS